MSKFNLGIKACGVFLLWATTVIALPAQTFTTLHSFNGTDGADPFGELTQASDGNLYGTTVSGGANPLSFGTVFRITTNGVLTTLHNFCLQTDCPDGIDPYGGLIQASDGYLYGTTSGGGPRNGGTVFKLTLQGKLTTVHIFCLEKRCEDGNGPTGRLVQDILGNLYGTTVYGGYANQLVCPLGCGTVFEIKQTGASKTLHKFYSSLDGESPWAGLVQGSDGAFYGTTYLGGNSTCASGCGTLFRSGPGKFMTLYNFCSQVSHDLCRDGESPLGGLVEGSDGNLYGVTEYGGAHDGGMFFKITPNGILTRLYSFCPHPRSGMCPDGSTAEGTLIQGSDGNFYGTTYFGGINDCTAGCGTIFKVTPTGALTTLHRFDVTDGSNPHAGLVQGVDGNLYGTTSTGGANGYGTVFSLSVGLK